MLDAFISEEFVHIPIPSCTAALHSHTARKFNVCSVCLLPSTKYSLSVYTVSIFCHIAHAHNVYFPAVQVGGITPTHPQC